MSLSSQGHRVLGGGGGWADARFYFDRSSLDAVVFWFDVLTQRHSHQPGIQRWNLDTECPRRADERERHEFGPFALLARPVHGQRRVEGDDVLAPHLSPRHRFIVDEAEHPELKTGRGVLEGPHKATDLEGHPSREVGKVLLG